MAEEYFKTSKISSYKHQDNEVWLKHGFVQANGNDVSKHKTYANYM